MLEDVFPYTTAFLLMIIKFTLQFASYKVSEDKSGELMMLKVMLKEVLVIGFLHQSCSGILVCWDFLRNV